MVELKDDQPQNNSNEVDDQEIVERGGELNLQEEQPTTQEVDSTRKIYKLEELVEEKEYSDQEYDELQKLYENTINEFVEGELIVGRVLAIGEKEVTIDIGFKSEGVIPIDEFSKPEELKVGEDVEVFLDNIEDVDGQLVLSRKKVDFIHAWEKVVDSHESGEILQGRCVRRIKGGIVVDLDGVDAFLPGSQIDVKPIRDFDAFIGRTIDFKVVKVNQLRKNIVVSHRVLVEEEMKEQREKILENLEKGQVLEGTVKNITDFGVFIDLGGVDGLLHINDLSWGRISHPSEIVALDETIKVQVLDFNDEKNRISLGLKQLQPHPWENVADKYPVDSVVKGKVVNISDYGAFIELEKGVEGLIHISEMSWTQHIKHPSKILAVGEIVEAKILSIDADDKKISLGLKQLEPDPWDTLEEKYPIGSKHEGKVRNLTNFGAFIELEEGIDGLIHISDLSWTKKIRHPGEVLKKADSIEVVVLNVDRKNRRISLGYKQTKENPWDVFEDQYKPGTVTKAKIVRLIEKGVIAELPEEVDGFIPLSHLTKPDIKKPSDGYKVDDELEVCVLEFNKEAKKIVLSENVDYAMSLISQKEVQDKDSKIEDLSSLFLEEAIEVAEDKSKPADVIADEPKKSEEKTPVEEKAEAAPDVKKEEEKPVEAEKPDEAPEATVEDVVEEKKAETEAVVEEEKVETEIAEEKTTKKAKTKKDEKTEAEADEKKVTKKTAKTAKPKKASKEESTEEKPKKTSKAKKKDDDSVEKEAAEKKEKKAAKGKKEETDSE